jgi:hypothetical protein
VQNEEGSLVKRSRPPVVGCLGLAALFLLVTTLLSSCGGKKKELIFIVGDEDGARVQGLVISDVGTGARLGVSDEDGQVSLMLARPKDSRLFLRLASPEQDGRPLYILEDEEIEIVDQDLKRGRRVIRVERSAPPESTSIEVASFRIASDPPGATVLINGVDKGLTPADLIDLSPGRIHVELRLAGYQPWSKDLLLTAEGTADTIVLQKAADTMASVRVESSPKGATIALDERGTGEKTPATLTGLQPGRHTIRLELAGYEPTGTRVELRAGEQAQVKLQLQPTGGPDEPVPPPPPPKPKRITYSVSAKPWALVYVDSDPVPRGESGPFKIPLAPGLHHFRCVNEANGTDVLLSRDLPSGDTSTILILDWQNGRITARRP